MSFLNYSHKKTLLKGLSLFSVIRGYNIVIIVLAQYLAALYIFAPENAFFKVLLDPKLFVIVVASALSIASGYIINNFYDSEKDLINRPNKTFLDNFVSQSTKLTVYFILNIMAVIFASYISFRAVVFFSVYIFMLWLYSHKLKKYPFVGNFTASVLTVTPFFAVFVYYQNAAPIIFAHASFLFLMVWIRELIKDLENIKGDLVLQYRTIPVAYGEPFAKRTITILCLLCCATIFLLLYRFNIGYMQYYFWFALLVMSYLLFGLWKAKNKRDYLILHFLMKLIIVVGVFSIVLIDVEFIYRFFVK